MRTLSRETSMSLLFLSARQIASLRDKGSAPPATPMRVRSGTRGVGRGRGVSNGLLLKSLSGICGFMTGFCADAAAHTAIESATTFNITPILLTPTLFLAPGLLRLPALL